jgi:hypothetical protein
VVRNPRVTVVLGGLLIVVAVVDAALVGRSQLVPWLRTTLLVLALPIGISGWVMTFRDLSNPIKRRR